MLVCPKCGSTYTRQLEFCGLDGERLVDSEVDPLIGRLIDRYRIEEVLGSGGMARVYRAVHIYLDESFAVKVLHGQIASDQSFAKRFHREAKTLSKIKHENVVRVVDFGATKEGLLFMVMEYLDGPTLTELLRDDGPFSPTRAARVARQLALGLSAAHGRGFVHRDLKPGNVIVQDPTTDEKPKILDFGLVRLLDPEDGVAHTQLTGEGMLFGTPAYMSPEQVAGNDVDSRSDLYALGVIIFQLLTGTAPFTGEPAQIARQHLSTDAPRPPLEYGGLTDLMMQLLEKEPVDRPETAADVVETIDRTGLATSDTERPRAAPRRSRPPRRVTPMAEQSPSLSGAMDSLEIGETVRAALGFRRHWRIVMILGLLAVVGFAAFTFSRPGILPPGIRAWFAGSVDKDAGQSPPDAGSQIAPPTQVAASAADAGLARGQKTPARVVPPPRRRPRPRPGRKPRNPPPSPPPEPQVVDPTPSIPEPVDAGGSPAVEPSPDAGAVDFYELDSSLGWALSSRGLSWDDIAASERDTAGQWARWFRTKSPPAPHRIVKAYETLMAAAKNTVIDSSLIATKLSRIHNNLARIPESVRDHRYEHLVKRANELRQRASGPQVPWERLAAEVTLLESDVKAARATAKKAPPAKTSTISG